MGSSGARTSLPFGCLSVSEQIAAVHRGVAILDAVVWTRCVSTKPTCEAPLPADGCAEEELHSSDCSCKAASR